MCYITDPRPMPIPVFLVFLLFLQLSTNLNDSPSLTFIHLVLTVLQIIYQNAFSSSFDTNLVSNLMFLDDLEL